MAVTDIEGFWFKSKLPGSSDGAGVPVGVTSGVSVVDGAGEGVAVAFGFWVANPPPPPTEDDCPCELPVIVSTSVFTSGTSFADCPESVTYSAEGFSLLIPVYCV